MLHVVMICFIRLACGLGMWAHMDPIHSIGPVHTRPYRDPIWTRYTISGLSIRVHTGPDMDPIHNIGPVHTRPYGTRYGPLYNIGRHIVDN